MQQIYVNGRFLAQSLSGVQRFALEITQALGLHWSSEISLPPVILVPQASGTGVTSLAVKPVGHRQGIAWEQIDLPKRASNGVLLNLGNTAPLSIKRQIVVIHDAAVFSMPESYSWKFRLWYKFMQTCLVKRGVKIITVSAFSRTELARHFGVPEASIGLISEGADHMHRIQADQSILSRHGLTRHGFVLAVGNLAAHKNLVGLTETARTLAKRQLPLVVTGGLNPAVFGQSTVGLPQPAKYLGRVSDEELKALYEAAACFVYPTQYEGFGLTVGEAMACGCPVVASGIPVLRETFDGAVLFCDPASPQDIARQVGRVLDEPTLATMLIQSGQRRAASLTWENAALSLEAIITDFTASPGRH